jgi:hypothetical protein
VAAHGYKAKYDYVELTVEPQGGAWRLTLRDNRHLEDVVHEDDFPTAEEAQEAAMALAVHHINIQHNDTVVMADRLSWQEY